jgi:hypothetical protein
LWCRRAAVDVRCFSFHAGGRRRADSECIFVVLGLAGEDGLNVGGCPAGPSTSEEVVWHVWDKALDVPQKLRRLTVARLLEGKKLMDALLSRGTSRLTNSVLSVV